MATVYMTEPPTRGKVLLHTTAGDIDIELWPREAPRACRNFVQLCLDGYYDGNAFHRIIRGLFVQTGDPSGAGTGGESAYGGYFPDELHTRLKFTHRGQVACANLNVPDSNTSQFFITLDKAPWLDKKHTIFGKVSGGTIFNVLRLGDVDVDADDRPLDPPRVLSAEVLDNPFEDVIARVRAPASSAASAAAPVARAKATAAKPGLLSFGAEAESDEEAGAGASRSRAGAAPSRIVSAHELLAGPSGGGSVLRAASAEAPEDAAPSAAVPSAAMLREAAPAAAPAAAPPVAPAAPPPPPSAAAAADADAEFERLREQVRAAKRGAAVEAAGAAGEAPAEGDATLSAAQRMRAKFRERKGTSATSREADTLARLAAFQRTLTGALRSGGGAAVAAAAAAAAEPAAYGGQVLEEDGADADADDGVGWMASKLHGRRHVDDAYRAGAAEVDDGLLTIDPLDERHAGREASVRQQHERHQQQRRQLEHARDGRAQHGGSRPPPPRGRRSRSRSR